MCPTLDLFTAILKLGQSAKAAPYLVAVLDALHLFGLSVCPSVLTDCFGTLTERCLSFVGPGESSDAQLFLGLCSLIGAVSFVLSAQMAGKNWQKIIGGTRRFPYKKMRYVILR